MHKFFLIFILLFSGSLFASYLKNGKYIIDYRYENFSVSYDVGIKSYRVFVDSKKVYKVLDLQSFKEIKQNRAFGLSELKEALLKDRPKGVIVTKKDGKIYKIKPKSSPYYAIYIKSIKKATASNYQSKERELRKNYTKWLKAGIKNYTIIMQDSRFKNLYPEGVKLTVKNGKIVKALDIRSYKNIEPSKYFLTVKKLFGVAKWGIKEAKIEYNDKTGYPQFIKIKNKITISSYSLKPL